jgi:hypothetical protein
MSYDLWIGTRISCLTPLSSWSSTIIGPFYIYVSKDMRFFWSQRGSMSKERLGIIGLAGVRIGSVCSKCRIFRFHHQRFNVKWLLSKIFYLIIQQNPLKMTLLKKFFKILRHNNVLSNLSPHNRRTEYSMKCAKFLDISIWVILRNNIITLLRVF